MNRMLSLANGRSELSDSFIGLQVLLVSISARRWTSLSSASASFSSSALRSPGVMRDHFLKTARAETTARSTSAAVPFGTLPTGFSVAGLMTSIRWREADSTSLPSMIILSSVVAGLLRDPGTGTRFRRIGGALRDACPSDDDRSRWAQSSKDRAAGEAGPNRRDRAGHRPCEGRPGSPAPSDRSGGLPERAEERQADDRRARLVAHRPDGQLHLQALPGRGVLRRQACQGDHLLEVGRPGRRGRLAGLASAGVHRD